MRMSGTASPSQVLARLQFYRERLRQEGAIWFLTRIIKRAWVVFAWVLLLPVTVLLHAAGYRRVTVFTDRIGHLSADIDCFLKEKALGRLPDRRWFVLAPPHRIANPCLLDYWREHVPVISSAAMCGLLEAMTWWRFMAFDISHYSSKVNATSIYYEISAQWGERDPIIRLTDEHAARGRKVLESMGMPRDAWFVCFHAREGGFSQADEIIQSHRNSDVLRLIPAMEQVIARGGWCIRMGDPSMRRLPPIAKVIDYAHHPVRSDWMDVFLCASCRFFVGNSSGLTIVSSIFGVPSALANMVPLSALGFHPRDISIPKLFHLKGETDYMRFPELFACPIADYRYALFYQDAGVEVEENSAEDIRDLVAEMLDRLDGKFVETDEDRKLQQRYRSLFRPGHYAYGAASRVGAAFLRKYRHLLD